MENQKRIASFEEPDGWNFYSVFRFDESPLAPHRGELIIRRLEERYVDLFLNGQIGNAVNCPSQIGKKVNPETDERNDDTKVPAP